MQGIPLTELSENLSPVRRKWDKTPIHTIKDLEQKPIVQDLYRGKVEKFITNCYRINNEWIDNFSFEELCKCNFSSIIMAGGQLGKLFEEVTQYRVLSKIRNSAWRWCVGTIDWNEMVYAYRGLQNFTLNLGEDFIATLDYTTGCNKMGYSEHARLYLDGVFAFLVHYRGEHVMTIGFSFLDKYRIIIRQVQCVQAIGNNHWMHKLPGGRLPFSLDRMKAAFPKFELYLVDGGKLSDDIVENYTQGLQEALHWHDKYQSWANKDSDSSERYRESADRKASEIEQLEQKLASLRKDRPKLVKFYRHTGHHRLGKSLSKMHGYRLVV